MKILVINCGSSSIKFQLFQKHSGLAKAAGECGNPKEQADKNDQTGKINPASQELITLCQGAISGLGSIDAVLDYQIGKDEIHKTQNQISLKCPDHAQGLSAILNVLMNGEQKIIKEVSQINLVGHRTVHGGETFSDFVFITPEVIPKMEECIPLAPVHNPANLTGIHLAQKLLPQARHVAVFDTAFHQALPEKAYTYAIPWSLYQNHGIRKYGFHGTSCRYVANRAAEVAGMDPLRIKTVVCHLGNGVTISAIDGGKSMDTSMGMTPLEDATMGTRCGDLDPGILLYLQRELKMDLKAVDILLNNQAGLLGLSGNTNDMRQIIKQSDQGHARSKLALEVFTYRIKKYIGAYTAALEGIDLLVFTGGIGENSSRVRSMILKGLGFLGMDLDAKLNENPGSQDTLINKADARVPLALVHTREEWMIAKDALDLLEEAGQ